MMASDHDAFRDSSGLYVLGALAPIERAAFEAHLSGCPDCTTEVETLRGVASALLYAVPQIEPPASLRARVLNAVAPSSNHAVATQRPIPFDAGSRGTQRGERAARLGARNGWLAMAALVLLALALGAYGVSLRQRIGALEAQLQEAVNRLATTEQQLVAARQAAEGVQLRLAVLTAPDMRQVNLAGQNPALRAAGRGFWSGSRGLVFAATDLPPVPAGRTYQLWYLTPTTPVSAGLFTPDATGTIAAAFDPPPAGRPPTGLAVSLEPDGGVPAPTGPIYLVGTTQ